MISTEALTPLALRAIDDPETRFVLGDALLEALGQGWYDPDIERLLGAGKCSPRRLAIYCASPSLSLARATASVLLFASWSTSRWPIPRVVAGYSETLRRLYPQQRIPQQLLMYAFLNSC